MIDIRMYLIRIHVYIYKHLLPTWFGIVGVYIYILCVCLFVPYMVIHRADGQEGMARQSGYDRHITIFSPEVPGQVSAELSPLP
jgi:hypothetical protein